MAAIGDVFQGLLAIPEQLERAANADVRAHFSRTAAEFLILHEGGRVDANLGFGPDQRAGVEPAERKRIGHRAVTHGSLFAAVGPARRDWRGQLGFGLEHLLEAALAFVVEGPHHQKTADVTERAHVLGGGFLIAAPRSRECRQHARVGARVGAQLLVLGGTAQ